MNDLQQAVIIIQTLLGFLSKSTDTSVDDLVYRDPAMVLRMKADEIENRDAEIQKARDFVKKHKR